MKEKFVSLVDLILLKRLSLAAKMLIFALALIAVSILTIVFSQQMNNDLSTMLASSSDSFKSSSNGTYIGDVKKSLTQLKGRVILYELDTEEGNSPDPDEFEFDLEELNDAILGLAGESASIESLKETSQKIELSWSPIKKNLDQTLKHLQNEEAPQAMKGLTAFIKEYKNFSSLISEISDKNANIAQKAYKITYQIQGASIYKIYAMAAINFLLGIVGFLFFYKLAKKLKQTTEVISDNNIKLSIESENLSETSNTLIDTVTFQQESITESVSAIAEISAMNKKTLDVSVDTSESAKKCQEIGKEGLKQFREVESAINNISRSNDDISMEVQRSNNEIKMIIDVINQISEKTKIINDIVFQTKLLSFNASVEAARAGEHGKGFSVVAEEVGALAAMSGKAADEIAKLLGESTKTVEDTISNSQSRMDNIIKDGSTKIQQGLDVAATCSKSLNEIVTQIEKLALNMSEVSSSSSEQSKGVDDVNLGLQQLSHSATTTVASSNNVKKSTENLNNSVLHLTEVIQTLKTIIEGQKKWSHKEKSLEDKNPQEPALKQEPEDFPEEDNFKVG